MEVHSLSTDPTGHVIDLVNDQLPDISISEEDKKKNLALLEEAKSVSERFLTRRGRKSRSSPGDSPSGRAGPAAGQVAALSPSEAGLGGGRGRPQLQRDLVSKRVGFKWPLPFAFRF